MNNKVTYRQQFTRCGKQRCRKCKESTGHGPYWYAYWSENGRTISKYIGIHLPPDIELPSSEPISNRAPSAAAELAATNTHTPISRHSRAVGNALNATPVPKATELLSPGTETNQSNPALRIYLLGQLRIERKRGNEWEIVTNRTWHRRRARALLGCLLSSSGRRSGREQAMEALWPDLDIETAANRLNGAVHEVRQVLEPEITRPAASHMLRLERDILWLADANSIWVDAEEFESLLNKANATIDAEQVEQLLEEASKLYAGDYLLEELYSEWATPRRESLRRGWMGLLLKLAELRVARGALTSAIEPLDRLLSADPTHETAVRRLMVILTQLDRRGEALRVYRRLADTLAREYESDPLPETSKLYEALRSGTFQMPLLSETPTSSAESNGTVSAPTQPIVPDLQPAEAPPKTGNTGFQRPALQLGRHNQSKLVGRELELTAMHQFLQALEKGVLEEATYTQAAADSGKLRTDSAKEAANSASRRGRTQKLTHFLLLMGESGIGKTRLAEEISYEANLRDWSVVWAHAYEQEGTIPYRPWTDILRTILKDVSAEFLLESLESAEKPETNEASSRQTNAFSMAYTKLTRLCTLAPELAAHLTLADSPLKATSALTPEQERLHLWEATTALLSVMSRSTPLLLVLDDLHWTDDSSLELLAYIVRHMQNEHIAIVATCRDIELAPTSNLRTLLNDLRREQALITLPVQPLDDGQIESLVAHLPQMIIKSIQSQAGGNPFFAEELARVSEAGLSPHHSDGRSARVLSMQAEEGEKEAATSHPLPSTMPETITAVLDRRLSRLSSDCQTLLGKVAVLGGSFEFSQLAYMVGDQGINEDAILDMLEEALRAGLLTEEGAGTHITYNFWHPLIVSHLYNRLSAARRAQLHRRAANALMLAHPGSEEEVAAAITHHLSKGGSDRASIAKYAELAANRAYTLSAYTEAEHYYRIAIEAISHGKNAKAHTVEDPLHLASLLERVAACNNIHGNYEEMRHLYERVLELRVQHHPEETHQKCQKEAQRQALILREIGRAWAETSDFDHAWQCYEQGKQVMQDAGVTSGAAWACLHVQQGNINWHRGNYDRARRYAQEALNMLEEVMQNQQENKPDLPITSSELSTRTALAMIGSPIELGRCHELLGILAATLGQYSEALVHLKRALAIFEQHDEVSALTMVYGNLGAVHAMRAENDIARTYFRRALEMAERNSDQPNIAFVTGNLGDVAARCGDLLEAEEWVRRSITLTELISEREQLSWNNVVLGSILQDLGDMQGALTHIRHGLAIGRAIKSVRFTGFALVALGDWRISRAIEVCNINFINVDTHVALQANGGMDILARARKAIERALTLEKLDVEVTIEGQLNLAIIYFLLGELERARQTVLQSIRDAREHELTRVQARSQRLLGRILAAQEHSAEADACFEQALDIFSRHEMRLDYARALNGYGITLLQRSSPGKPAFLRGLAYLQEAHTIFVRCKAAIDIQWVERILLHYDYESAHV